jgi:hypothetical protein
MTAKAEKLIVVSVVSKRYFRSAVSWWGIRDTCESGTRNHGMIT